MINGRRRVLQRLSSLRKAVPSPVSGKDALVANQISSYDDPTRFTRRIGELCDELEERVKSGEGVAQNPCMRELMVKEMEGEVVVPENPCLVGALGAALLLIRE